ncbi:MAG: hypothetical protein WC284_16885 [Candidimonas sp.]
MTIYDVFREMPSRWDEAKKLWNSDGIEYSFDVGKSIITRKFSNGLDAYRVVEGKSTTFYAKENVDDNYAILWIGKTFDRPWHIKAITVRVSYDRNRWEADHTMVYMETANGIVGVDEIEKLHLTNCHEWSDFEWGIWRNRLVMSSGEK